MRNLALSSTAHRFEVTLPCLFALAGLVSPLGCSGRPLKESAPESVAEKRSPSEETLPTVNTVVELPVVELPVGDAEDGGFTISQVMLIAHENKFYREVLGESPDPEAIAMMQKLYADLPKRTPPKGEIDGWKERATALISAVDSIAAGDPTGGSQLKRAVNCSSCHSRHR